MEISWGGRRLACFWHWHSKHLVFFLGGGGGGATAEIIARLTGKAERVRYEQTGLYFEINFNIKIAYIRDVPTFSGIGKPTSVSELLYPCEL